MKIFILLAVVACALATPIDDKSSVLSASSSSNPDISTLPLKKDVPSKLSFNSTKDSDVHSHPLHKRDVNAPPRAADNAGGVNSKNSSSPSNSHNETSSISGQKIQPSSPFYSRVSREAQGPGVTQSSLKSQTPTTPSSNYNPAALYNQQRKPAAVPNSKPIQPASLNPSAPRPLNNQPLLSQASRVKRDAPSSVDQKSSASKPQDTLKPVTNQDQPLAKKPQPDNIRKTRDAPSSVDQKSSASKPQDTLKPVTNQDLPLAKKPQPDNIRKTRDAPKPADLSLNKKTQDQTPVTGQKADKPVVVGQLAKDKSRTVREAPNPVEQSKIVPSAHQPLKVNDDKKSSSSESVTATPPLIAKTPQHKRESVPLSTSSDKQAPQFVHPVPVDHILKKPSSDSSSRSSDSKIDSSNPTSEIKPSSTKP